jgi:hypothetical protein
MIFDNSGFLKVLERKVVVRGLPQFDGMDILKLRIRWGRIMNIFPDFEQMIQKC